MFFRRRARYYYDRFSASDPVTQVIALAALLILAIIALPALWARLPGAASGVACANLPMPRLGGSNQSLLSAQVDSNALRLELAPDPIVINQGQPLDMEVRFINNSVAPLTLFFVPDEVTFRYTEQEAGLLFSITSGGVARGDQPSVYPPYPVRQQFTQNQLRILGPRQRCSEHVQIDPARLNAAQVIQGEYRITAVYRNLYKGVLPPVGALTPTPIFRDQGVWTGTVQSNEIRVIIGLPTQPPPTQ
jgi:hypothetical protein